MASPVAVSPRALLGLSVPVGGGFGRVFRVGRQPMNASLQAYGNVIKPDGFGDVAVRAQIQFLFPKRGS